jgi:hypothetical protein
MTPERLRALVRLLVNTGDLTPAGARILTQALDDEQ